MDGQQVLPVLPMTIYVTQMPESFLISHFILSLQLASPSMLPCFLLTTFVGSSMGWEDVLAPGQTALGSAPACHSLSILTLDKPLGLSEHCIAHL